MHDGLKIIISIAIILSVICGMYWVGKTVSYKIFYENMVQETIVEMVKPKALK